jgi:capsular polysaccharide transport system permease protein
VSAYARDGAVPGDGEEAMSNTDARRKFPLSASFAIQLRTIRALLIREAQSRYSNETLGFFWVIAEPLLLTCGVIVLWMLTRQGGSKQASVGIVPLALTAYSHIQLWRMTVLGAIRSLRRTGWLLYHQNINALDILLSQGLLLSVSIFASFVLVSSACVMFDIFPPVRDPGLIVAAWCLDTLFCISFAIVVAGLSELSEFAEKVLHPLMYLTLPLTGAFTMTAWLPPRARVVVDWSPLANACEMLRAGVFPLSVKTSWSASYIFVVSLALLALGLPLLGYARRQISVA